ncbi:hypothetical protein L1987_17016 [Smallanthus sonchifolius]|uniref:Uncharacterized protein n=1 Tax=Smallanthus sonchifolius TaxID=185202 RepID=A0ACB9IWB6_9ASTR|nr:hypothetical protein L1987_17016 [Smallanthus sonchifolius]
MVKAAYYDENGLKKGAWSEDEDNKLKTYIKRYGHWNWGLLPKFAGVSRSDVDTIGDYNLLPSYNFVDDFICQSSWQNMVMTDEFLWSTFDAYVEDNMKLIMK